jgi:hypothetical protein
VIDTMPDFIRLMSPQGEEFVQPVIQIWCDPNYPDAHRDPALRAYLARRAEEHVMALVRYDSQRAFVLVPPGLNDGEWLERDAIGGAQHSIEEIAAVMGAAQEAGA